ncbi:protein arv1 homolog [Schistocerca gregaria]|uniref:protein arv1 homolog n=1 Tax=Schistocerca gregaria TaxID=7010 RepID=UPI00211EAEB0|nr:protein arv1 homolog [Schistocerca gregaria]
MNRPKFPFPWSSYVCVECGMPVSSLYSHVGSKQDIQLTICEHCHNFADKYVEFDNVLIILDLLLHKISVCRHMVFNLSVSRHHRIPYVKVILLSLLLIAYTRLYYLDLDDPLQSNSRNLFTFWIVLLEYIVSTVILTLFCMLYFRTYKFREVFAEVTVVLSVTPFPSLVLLFAIIWKYQLHFLLCTQLFTLSSQYLVLKTYLKSSASTAFLGILMSALSVVFIDIALSRSGYRIVSLLVPASWD